MTRRIGWACLLVASTIVALPGYAADESGKWYVAPEAGYVITDHIRAVDNDAYYGLAIGKHVTEHWSAELNVNRGTYHHPAGGKLDLTTFSIDALRVFARRSPVSPFLTGGVGYSNDDFHPGPSRGDFLGQVGAGLLIDVAGNSRDSFLLQLRPQIKARWDWNDVGRGRPLDYLFGVGVIFAFGGGHTPWVARATEPATSGTPAAAPIVQPAPAAPAAPPPPPVPPSSIVLSGVNFAFNSAQLAPSAHPVLDQLAEDLQRAGNQQITVAVQGHTDNVGRPDYNLKLSQHRAEAVRDYLVARGVAANRISATGYGAARPVADNHTPDGRAQNRRVVVNVINNPDRVNVIGDTRP